MIVVKLEEQDSVKSFDCGDDDLNDFILHESPLYRKDARGNALDVPHIALPARGKALDVPHIALPARGKTPRCTPHRAPCTWESPRCTPHRRPCTWESPAMYSTENDILTQLFNK